MSDPLSLEPRNGDFVAYIEALQAGKIKPSDGAQPPAAAPLPPVRKGKDQDGIGLGDLIGALRRKPGSTPAQKRAGSAVERMERSARVETAAAKAPPRRQKADPAAQFISSAFCLFGLMGLIIGIDEGNPPVLIFAGFAVFVGLLIQVQTRLGGRK